MGWFNERTIEGKRVVWAWGFLALPLLFFAIVRFWPTAEAFWVSFHSWKLIGARSWVGFDNYVQLAADPLFWKVFKNTFLYLLIGTPISIVISFTIAYHLDRVRFMHGFIRALYFLPFITTAAAMAWVWRWFYQPLPVGVINNALSSLGIPQAPFLNSTTWALPSVLATAVWHGLGFQVIIFLAGLRAIPQTYYEAARMDGVSNVTILREITIPLLKPTTVFLVVFSSIAYLRIFDQVYNMTTNDPGGPLNATKPLVLMIYQTAFRNYELGYAAAQTVVLFLVLLAISLFQLRLMKAR
jgi:multiple sugar transport system permease protein